MESRIHGVMESWSCGVMFSVLSAGIYIPSSMNKEEQLMKKSTIHLCTLSYFKVKNVSNDLNLYSRDALSADALLILT